jgi:hypothetical protein
MDDALSSLRAQHLSDKDVLLTQMHVFQQEVLMKEQLSLEAQQSHVAGLTVQVASLCEVKESATSVDSQAFREELGNQKEAALEAAKVVAETQVANLREELSAVHHEEKMLIQVEVEPQFSLLRAEIVTENDTACDRAMSERDDSVAGGEMYNGDGSHIEVLAEGNRAALNYENRKDNIIAEV